MPGTMQGFPHRHTVAAAPSLEGDVALDADRLPTLHSDAPTEFDGPGDQKQAQRLLAKTEQTCLVVNSLKAASHLEAEVNIVPA